MLAVAGCARLRCLGRTAAVALGARGCARFAATRRPRRAASARRHAARRLRERLRLRSGARDPARRRRRGRRRDRRAARADARRAAIVGHRRRRVHAALRRARGRRRAGGITAYEGRETAPAAATPDMFLGANGARRVVRNVGVGGLAVGVPGALRMLELAHREHGRLPWAELFAPAIELAESGFEVSPRLFGLLNGFKRFARGEDFRRYFYDASGEPHPVGYRLKNPDVRGGVAHARRAAAPSRCTRASSRPRSPREVRDNNVRPGRMTPQDLATYEAHVSAPLCTPYRDVARLRAAAAVVGRRDDAASARHARRTSSCRTFATSPCTRFTCSPRRTGSRSPTAISISAIRSSWPRPVAALLDDALSARARRADRLHDRRCRRSSAGRAAAGARLGSTRRPCRRSGRRRATSRSSTHSATRSR